MARYLRECRQQLGLSLREVQQQTASCGSPIPSSTICKIEQGKVEPGLVRIRQLLEVYRQPLHEAADLLELEALVGSPPEHDSPAELFERGQALLKQGKVRDSLAALLPLRQAANDDEAINGVRQRTLIVLSVALQRLGRHRLALRMIEDLLVEGPEPALRVNAHVQAARVWLDLGGTEIAMAFMMRAQAHLAHDDKKGAAWIRSHEAELLRRAGELDEANARAAEAARLLAEVGDQNNLVRMMAQLADLRLEAGDAEGSLAAAREGLEHAEANGFGEPVARLRLYGGRALIRLERREEGLAELQRAMAAAVELDDLSLQFLAHYHLWKGYLEVGNRMRAEFELGAARSYLRFSDERSEEAREIRSLEGSRGNDR
jgi:tetratricopeptide (TPR) repeat protein